MYPDSRCPTEAARHTCIGTAAGASPARLAAHLRQRSTCRSTILRINTPHQRRGRSPAYQSALLARL